MKRKYVLVIITLLVISFVFNFKLYNDDDASILVLTIVNVISLITVTTILFGNKKVESKISWSMFILIVPIVGTIFYLLLGVEYNRFKKFDSNEEKIKVIDDATDEELDNIIKIKNNLGSKKDIISFIYKTYKNRVTINNRTEVLTNGDAKLKRLLEELDNAKSFINIEYFIVKEGIMFDKIKEILIAKAKQGIEIRMLFDDFGCVRIKYKTIQELNNYGIKTAFFNPINFRLFRPSINYRNHRKIVVIDNKVAFTGGINIGDEYIHRDKYYGFWRDTHLLIEGCAVKDLNVIFAKDWYNSTKELLYDKKYFNKHIVKNNDSAIQIIGDGPDNKESIINKAYFKMINEANKRVWITTPYLILNSELLAALKVAALSGIDVRILVPGKTDKNKDFTYKATEAYFSELLQNKVKIYKYKDKFIHSKVLIIDDEIASVGTVNFDYRSFNLHFEITALLYFDESIKKLVQDFEEDLTVSKEILWEEWKKRNKLQKIIESLVKIFSPIL